MNRLFRSRRRQGRGRGQSLVEFALVFPIFILVLFGLLDVGRLIFATAAVSNAAREGARLGSVEASWTGSPDSSCGAVGGPVCPANDYPGLYNDITAAANRQMAPFGTVSNLYMNCVLSTGTPPTGNWTTKNCASQNSGGQLSVRVIYTWRALTPIISDLIGPVTASGSATVTIN
jgi:Flp pilus assembly protein TadG